MLSGITSTMLGQSGMLGLVGLVFVDCVRSCWAQSFVLGRIYLAWLRYWHVGGGLLGIPGHALYTKISSYITGTKARAVNLTATYFWSSAVLIYNTICQLCSVIYLEQNRIVATGMLANCKTTPIGRITMVTLGGVKASLSIVIASPSPINPISDKPWYDIVQMS